MRGDSAIRLRYQRAVHAIRRLARRHAGLAALLVALALCLKVFVPSGFMPVAEGGKIVVALCSGTGGAGMTMTIPTGPHDPQDDGAAHHGEQQCAFGSLAGHALASTDPVLLAAAVLFAFLAAIFWLPQVLPARTGRILPPLRGPPAAI